MEAAKWAKDRYLRVIVEDNGLTSPSLFFVIVSRVEIDSPEQIKDF